MSRPLCLTCEQTEQTHQDSGPCLDVEAKVYSNCFNRLHCDQLKSATDAEIIEAVLSSGCMSLNFTRQGRSIVESRLRKIVEKLL